MGRSRGEGAGRAASSGVGATQAPGVAIGRMHWGCRRRSSCESSADSDRDVASRTHCEHTRTPGHNIFLSNKQIPSDKHGAPQRGARTLKPWRSAMMSRKGSEPSSSRSGCGSGRCHGSVAEAVKTAPPPQYACAARAAQPATLRGGAERWALRANRGTGALMLVGRCMGAAMHVAPQEAWPPKAALTLRCHGRGLDPCPAPPPLAAADSPPLIVPLTSSSMQDQTPATAPPALARPPQARSRIQRVAPCSAGPARRCAR